MNSNMKHISHYRYVGKWGTYLIRKNKRQKLKLVLGPGTKKSPWEILSYRKQIESGAETSTTAEWVNYYHYRESMYCPWDLP